MRKIINHHHCNHMIKAYQAVKDITDDGGLAYETKSAIWTYEPRIERVMLIVKAPDNMSNGVLDYTKNSKHFEKHKQRIIKLTNAKPVITRYKMGA